MEGRRLTLKDKRIYSTRIARDVRKAGLRFVDIAGVEWSPPSWDLDM